MTPTALLIFVLILGVAAFMAYERSFKSAAFLGFIAMFALAGALLSDPHPPAPKREQAPQPAAARLAKAPSDPGPTKLTEIAFEAGVKLCTDGSECLSMAFVAAFENDCRAAVTRWLRTDYRLHPDEAVFLSVRRVSPTEFRADGRSLFVQDTRGAYRRSAWECIATRSNSDGSRRSDYLVYAIPPLT